MKCLYLEDLPAAIPSALAFVADTSGVRAGSLTPKPWLMVVLVIVRKNKTQTIMMKSQNRNDNHRRHHNHDNQTLITHIPIQNRRIMKITERITILNSNSSDSSSNGSSNTNNSSSNDDGDENNSNICNGTYNTNI